MAHTTAKAAAARLHEIADRLAAVDGPIPTAWLSFCVVRVGPEADRRGLVDALALALTGQPGEAQQAIAGWEHIRQVRESGIDLRIYTDIAPPPAENPATLRARIAELEARLGATGGAAA